MALIAAGAPPSATAAPGDLDPTFSQDGATTTSFPGASSARLNDLVLQPDGNIVAVGIALIGEGSASDATMAIARYRPDGSLNTSFSDDGLEMLSLGEEADAQAIALQPDGKLVVAGMRFGAEDSDAAIVRLNPDGSLDPTFGSDGVAVIDLPEGPSVLEDAIYDVAIQADGRILAAGTSPNNATLLRLLPDGRLDDSFSGDGIATGPAKTFQAIALTPEGQVLVAGDGSDVVVLRYTSAGELDPSFADGGVARNDFGWLDEGATSIALRPDNRIVVGANSCGGLHPGCQALLLQYTTSGDLDTGFASGPGYSAQGGRFVPNDGVVLQPNGRALLVGNVAVYETVGAYKLFRFNGGGGLDHRFSRLGERWESQFHRIHPRPFRGTAPAGAIAQSDASTLTVGATVYLPSSLLGTFALARYELNDGPPDTDADRVRDKKDRCPQDFGKRKNGCPPGEKPTA